MKQLQWMPQQYPPATPVPCSTHPVLSGPASARFGSSLLRTIHLMTTGTAATPGNAPPRNASSQNQLQVESVRVPLGAVALNALQQPTLTPRPVQTAEHARCDGCGCAICTCRIPRELWPVHTTGQAQPPAAVAAAAAAGIAMDIDTDEGVPRAVADTPVAAPAATMASPRELCAGVHTTGQAQPPTAAVPVVAPAAAAAGIAMDIDTDEGVPRAVADTPVAPAVAMASPGIGNTGATNYNTTSDENSISLSRF